MKLSLDKNSQETDNEEQAADKRCTSSESGAVSTAGVSIARASSTVFGSTGDGVSGRLAGETCVRGSLDVEVGGRVTQALANGLEGKFGDVLQSSV